MPDQADPLVGRRVLVVEDEAMVALLLEDMLRELGCTVAAVAGSLPEAIEIAGTADIDLAVLDINLAGEPVFPVAARLSERAVPFVFSTGYGRAALGGRWPAAPLVSKPFATGELETVLRRALAAA